MCLQQPHVEQLLNTLHQFQNPELTTIAQSTFESISAMGRQ